MNDVVTVTTFYLDVMYAGIDGGDGAWAIHVLVAFVPSVTPRHLEAFMKLLSSEGQVLRDLLDL